MTPGPLTVVWKRSAIEIQIAEIVADLMSRGKPVGPVTKAMDLIERALASHPTEVGESRPNFERIIRNLRSRFVTLSTRKSGSCTCWVSVIHCLVISVGEPTWAFS